MANRTLPNGAEATDTSAGSLFGHDAADTSARLDPTPSAPPTEAPDPFDPDALRLSQDFASAVGVKKLLTTIPVRNPDKESFVRVHPDPAYHLQTVVLELREDRGETYLVAPALWKALAEEKTCSPRLLVTSITRQGVLFLWPLKLPGSDGRSLRWHDSALEAAEVAKTEWVRVTSNMALGAYETCVASAALPEPTWPDMPLGDMLRIAFRDRLIDRVDHPVLRRLRGEI